MNSKNWIGIRIFKFQTSLVFIIAIRKVELSMGEFFFTGCAGQTRSGHSFSTAAGEKEWPDHVRPMKKNSANDSSDTYYSTSRMPSAHRVTDLPGGNTVSTQGHRPARWNLSVLLLPDDSDIRVGIWPTSEQYIGSLLYRHILWTLYNPWPLCTETILQQLN